MPFGHLQKQILLKYGNGYVIYAAVRVIYSNRKDFLLGIDL